jgi:hypothetical protein
MRGRANLETLGDPGGERDQGVLDRIVGAKGTTSSDTLDCNRKS